MKKEKTQFPLRVAKELMQKLSYVAGANGRSANKEIEMLIKEHVKRYEKENGKISLED